jgi:hypothetical protein
MRIRGLHALGGFRWHSVAMQLGMGTLVLRRPAARWRDRLRAYRIEVDGETCVDLRQGESRVLELPPGPHRVRARIDWTGSPEVEVEVVAGATLECRVEPAGPAIAVLWQIFGRDQYLRMSTTS